ncbi:MAG: carboxypeptidase regulatory-like domain-containing protein [Acidobacteria bacterium]|nr:carboxypeptidase regulatory-like domain-containing protein [Acidobacteriota bacterium]MDW7983635.1 carboxypeptidase regulatory-like domain-containing protein [Acidobacteriota bacterium]
MRPWVRWFVWGIVSLGWAFPSWGQEQAGRLEGRVTDPEGRPLAGVRVELESPTLGRWLIHTDVNGFYRFLHVPPGDDYRLRVEHAGFRTVQRTGLLVRVGQQVQVDVMMAPGAEAEVVVMGPPPALDTRQVEVVSNFHHAWLQRLPTARDPWALLELAPGLVVREINVGGVRSGNQAFFYGRGETRDNAHWYLDGLLVTDPVERGASVKFYDFDALEEIHVVTGAADVEVFAGGVTVNLVTRRGGGRLSGTVRTIGTGDVLQAENVKGLNLLAPDSRGNRIRWVLEAGASLGGRLRPDSLWFWLGYGYQGIDVWVPSSRGDLLERTRLYDVNFKLTGKWGTHRWEAHASTGWSRKANVGGGADRTAAAVANQETRTPIVRLQDDWFPSPKAWVTVRLGAVLGHWLEQMPVGGTATPVLYDAATGLWDGSHRWERHRRFVYQGTLQGVLYSPPWLGAGHELKLGAEFRLAPASSQVQWGNGVMYLYDDRSRPALGGEVAFFRMERARPYVNMVSFYIQDTWALGRWNFQAGLRYDRQWSGLGAVEVPAHPDVPDWLPAGRMEAERLPFTWHTLSPRLGIIWDIRGNGRTLLKFGLSRYPSTLDTRQAADMTTTTLREIRFRWTGDRNGNSVPDPEEIDFSRPTFWNHAPRDPDRRVNTIDPSFQSPFNWEVMAGLEWTPAVGFRTALYGFYRKLYNRKEPFPYDPNRPTEVQAYYDCWVVEGTIPAEWGGWPYYMCTVPKPPGVRWINLPDYHRDYWGAELRVEAHAPGRRSLTASLTWEHFIHDFPTRRSYLDPTNIAQLHRAAAASGGVNIRWMAKVAGTFRLPGDLWVGATLTARDGFPFLSRYRVLRTSNGWGRTVLVDTHRVGSVRLPVFWMVHLRMERSFAFGQRHMLQVALEVFNPTNNAIPLGWYTRADQPQLYRKVTEVTSPRVIRLGLRYFWGSP